MRNLDLARALLDRGADANARDAVGHTGLHCATRWGEHDLMQLLLLHGADPSPVDRHSETPLMVAAYRRDTDGMRLLHERGADADRQDPAWGTTALLIAREGVDLPSVQLLLSYRPTLRLRDAHGQSALTITSDPRILRLLHEAQQRSRRPGPAVGGAERAARSRRVRQSRPRASDRKTDRRVGEG
ncbi:MAG TPA: ankyrin repeat domain-containing protein [Chthonomonadaceae bacterium]|nr:ankyrin repeat domain-containing protein [Chthonomonadaceae bacterium]